MHGRRKALIFFHLVASEFSARRGPCWQVMKRWSLKIIFYSLALYRPASGDGGGLELGSKGGRHNLCVSSSSSRSWSLYPLLFYSSSRKKPPLLLFSPPSVCYYMDPTSRFVLIRPRRVFGIRRSSSQNTAKSYSSRNKEFEFGTVRDSHLHSIGFLTSCHARPLDLKPPARNSPAFTTAFRQRIPFSFFPPFCSSYFLVSWRHKRLTWENLRFFIDDIYHGCCFPCCPKDPRRKYFCSLAKLSQKTGSLIKTRSSRKSQIKTAAGPHHSCMTCV